MDLTYLKINLLKQKNFNLFKLYFKNLKFIKYQVSIIYSF